MTVSPWIELDERSDAYIQVQFSDSGDHDECEDEEGEDDGFKIPGMIDFTSDLGK